MALALLLTKLLFHMIRQAVAWVLLALVVMPFTPPFEVCDVGTFFGRATFGSLQIDLARSVEVDSHAAPDRATASRRMLPDLKPISETVGERSADGRASQIRYVRFALVVSPPGLCAVSRAPLRI